MTGTLGTSSSLYGGATPFSLEVSHARSPDMRSANIGITMKKMRHKANVQNTVKYSYRLSSSSFGKPK
jgi:hypothetical protein